MDDYNGENENANFSVKQLKVNLKNTLKQSGVLSTVKAQIRQEFINGLTAKTRINAALSLSMNDRIMYSSVYHLLRNRRMVNSISVFSAESGLDPKLSLISEEDIVRMVKFNGLSNVYKFMQNSAISNQQTADNLPLDSDQKSLLDVMMQFCLSAGGGSKEMSVQTETSGPSAREILDDRIYELRRTYQVSKEVQNLNPNKTIEERMVAFQRDCEKRLARDLEIQVTHIRENELARVRLEEQSRAHEEMENMRKRLDFEYGKRLQAHIEVESDSAKRLVDQEHATQRALYENRQFMQREIDELRSRESAATRRAELESQGIRALEHRLKESLCMIETREADMQRREQAVEEARKGYQETAHREALARVQSELEILSRERSSLMIEKQHFADEVGAQKALVSSALALKGQLKAQSEELICREEELQAMQRAAQRLQLQREEEDLQIKKMLEQIDPALGSYTRCEQIVALIQQKADLQVQLAGFRDAHLLQQKMQKMEQEMAAVQGELRESRVQLESNAQQAALQKEHLERAVLAERAKVASQVHKLDELRQLLHDKTLTVDSLRRQLEGSSSSNGGNGSNSNNYHTNHNADFNRQHLHKNNMSQSQQRAHMSVTDQRAVDFLRRNGNYVDAERAQGYANTTEPAPTGPTAASSLIDNVIQRLLLEQLQGQVQHTMHTTASGNVGVAAAPLSVDPSAAPAVTTVVPAPTTDDAALQAQKAQHAAELTQLAHTLQQEQLKAAEMKTQIEQQKLEQERLAWSLQREKLEAQQRMRELKETEEAAARERERVMERDREANREREVKRERELEVERRERLATSAAPVYAPPHTNLFTATVPGPVASMPPPVTVPVEEHRTEGKGLEDADRDRQNQKAADEQRQTEDEVVSKALQAAQVQRQTEQAAALQAEKDATTAAAAAEVVAREQRERLAAQERELERQRREADEWEQKQQQRETERVAAAAKTKEEERLREEHEQEQELKKERLAQQARDDEQARLLQAEQEAQEEAERVQREHKEKEEKEQREAEERRLQDEREQKEREHKEREEKERDEREREEQELLNNSALIRLEEAARAAREEEERERAEEAARVEAKEQARLKQEEDEKEIMAARQRVLERRRAAADRNNRMTSSLPTSLQTATANSGETDSTSTSQNQSTLSHLGSAMMPGVSTSLDSFAPGAGGNRNAPNKNLFPSSFQNLQDSDSSSDRMEVGDMSEEQDSSGMF